MSEVMLLSNRIKADKITIESSPAGPPDDEVNPDPAMNWYDVTLRMDGREFSLPFGLGSAHTEPPSVSDVMSLVILGVRSVYYNPTLEAWADDWGSNPDSEDTQVRYRQWTRILARFRAFLSVEFIAYMDDTQDDT